MAVDRALRFSSAIKEEEEGFGSGYTFFSVSKLRALVAKRFEKFGVSISRSFGETAAF
jgi:hypothetical protein